MLAQINPDSLQIAGGLASMFFVIGGVNAGLKLIDRLRGQPAADQLKVIAEEMSRRVTQLETLRGQDIKDQEERRRDIYSQVDRTRLELKQDIKAIDDRLGAMPAQIVALLRNTGALR